VLSSLNVPVQNFIYAAASPWTVTVTPNSNGLPGNSVWDSMTGALLHWGLIASVAAIVIGTIVWQVAGHGHNPHWAARGRVGALMGGAGAFLTGAAPAIVNFFAQAGQKVH
jgi:hypothetical protein